MAKRLGSVLVGVLMFTVLAMGSAMDVAAQSTTTSTRTPITAGARLICPNNDCSLVFPDSYDYLILTFASGNQQIEYRNTVLRGYMRIHTGKLNNPNTSLADYVQNVMDNTASDPEEPGYRLLAPAVYGMLGGSPAATFAYTANDSANGSQLNTRLYVTLHNGLYYVLEFYALPKDAEVFFDSIGNILNSFQFM